MVRYNKLCLIKLLLFATSISTEDQTIILLSTEIPTVPKKYPRIFVYDTSYVGNKRVISDLELPRIMNFNILELQNIYINFLSPSWVCLAIINFHKVRNESGMWYHDIFDKQLLRF